MWCPPDKIFSLHSVSGHERSSVCLPLHLSVSLSHSVSLLHALSLTISRCFILSFSLSFSVFFSLWCFKSGRSHQWKDQKCLILTLKKAVVRVPWCNILIHVLLLTFIISKYCNDPAWDWTGDPKHGTNRLAQPVSTLTNWAMSTSTKNGWSQPRGYHTGLTGHLRVPSQFATVLWWQFNPLGSDNH